MQSQQSHTAAGRRWPLVLGAVAWIVSTAQYLAAQVIAAAAWHHPTYSWSRNYISDLGNTACGTFSISGGPANYVCSPDHALMNTSFILTGVLSLAGLLLITRYWKPSKRRTAALWIWALACALKAVVGLVPENTNAGLHTLGALNLPLTSVAILLLGLSHWRTRRWEAVFSLTISVVALIGAVLFSASQSGSTALDLGQGIGGMERLAGYPSNLWIVVIALAALATRPQPSTDTQYAARPLGAVPIAQP